MVPSRARPDFAALAGAVETQLKALQSSMRQPVESEIERGRLTAPQRSVMRALTHAEQGLALKDLSAEVGLSHSTVSGIVDRLHERGWLDRTADSVDRRRTVITVSAKVRQYIRKTLPQLTVNPLAAALADMTASERDKLLSSLTALNQALARRLRRAR
jgi:DNA-binding MarR family transcriptional regulator